MENEWANDTDRFALAAHPGKSQGPPPKTTGSKPIVRKRRARLRSPQQEFPRCPVSASTRPDRRFLPDGFSCPDHRQRRTVSDAHPRCSLEAEGATSAATHPGSETALPDKRSHACAICLETRAIAKAGLDQPIARGRAPRHEQGKQTLSPTGCSSHSCTGRRTRRLVPPRGRGPACPSYEKRRRVGGEAHFSIMSSLLHPRSRGSLERSLSSPVRRLGVEFSERPPWCRAC